ncbi:MAG: hypothetical protein CFE43_07545 [Burkholderiales bacterium PBB3]|nr:MAG: hypothetical protein CFE43_07545 [Burkholderiales bacterium PBB3]
MKIWFAALTALSLSACASNPRGNNALLSMLQVAHCSSQKSNNCTRPRPSEPSLSQTERGQAVAPSVPMVIQPTTRNEAKCDPVVKECPVRVEYGSGLL